MRRWQWVGGLALVIALMGIIGATGNLPLSGAWNRYGLMYIAGEHRASSLDTMADGQIVVGRTGAAPAVVNGCFQILAVEINPTEASATNDFVNLVDNSFSATEADENMFMVPVAVYAHSLRAEVATAPGVGNDAWAVTLRDDVASTTLTCTIDEALTSCADSTNRPLLAAGSKLAVLVSSAGSDADPTATASITISFCLGL